MGSIEFAGEIRINSTKSNGPGIHYRANDKLLDSIYLNYDNTKNHIIYESSKDNSIGIASFTSVLEEKTTKRLYSFGRYRG